MCYFFVDGFSIPTIHSDTNNINYDLQEQIFNFWGEGGGGTMKPHFAIKHLEIKLAKSVYSSRKMW